MCDCWVSLVSAEARFAIRYGAHNPTCPVFRPTLDPVDALHDAELRYRVETRLERIGVTIVTKESHPEVWAVLER